MLTYESSVSIAAPRDAVWRALSDVTAWPDWLPTVVKVEPLDGQGLSLGARFVIQQPKLRPTTWVVSELQQPRRFVWVARAPGLKMIAEHTVEDDVPAKSTVILRFSFTGLLGGIIGRVFHAITKRYLAQEAASLKQTVEASI